MITQKKTATAGSDETIVLRMSGISKSFPGVQALKDITFTLKRGEIHIILGENGAGKSTLMKILAGVYTKDEGSIVLHGKEVDFQGVRDAAGHGIGFIPQELDLIPTLSVAQNIYLGRETDFSTFGYIHNKAMADASAEAMRRVGVSIDPNALVRNLSVAMQQMVVIVRALEQHPSILIMDEPTSALGEEETDDLFATIKRLVRDEGISICYISHRLAEFSRIGDRVTILRDGSYIDTLEVGTTSRETLIRLMVGRELGELFPKKVCAAGREVIRVDRVSRNNFLSDISFTVREGEVVGLFGLVGAGRTELARVIFGADRPTGGAIYLKGKEISIGSPQKAVDRGIGLLPEDRKNQGLLLKMDLCVNTTLARFAKVLRWGLLSSALEKKAAQTYVDDLKIRTPGIRQQARYLSGGNQQKVLLARWLFAGCALLIFDEPTRGIDVGAKQEIYNIINLLTARGVAILMISSELPEILAMSDRIIVMHEGRLTAEFSRDEADQETIMHCATGKNYGGAAA